MSPAPVRKHQALAAQIIREIANQLDDCTECEILGEVDYKVSDDTLLRPDVVFTCNETGEAYLTKAPEIVVEIVSPSTARKDERIKYQIYEREKAPYYILAYPDDLKAKIYRLGEKGYEKQGDFTHESDRFDDLPCAVEIDFERVFKRFR